MNPEVGALAGLSSNMVLWSISNTAVLAGELEMLEAGSVCVFVLVLVVEFAVEGATKLALWEC